MAAPAPSDNTLYFPKQPGMTAQVSSSVKTQDCLVPQLYPVALSDQIGIANYAGICDRTVGQATLQRRHQMGKPCGQHIEQIRFSRILPQSWSLEHEPARWEGFGVDCYRAAITFELVVKDNPERDGPTILELGQLYHTTIKRKDFQYVNPKGEQRWQPPPWFAQTMRILQNKSYRTFVHANTTAVRNANLPIIATDGHNYVIDDQPAIVPWFFSKKRLTSNDRIISRIAFHQLAAALGVAPALSRERLETLVDEMQMNSNRNPQAARRMYRVLRHSPIVCDSVDDEETG